MGRSKATEFTTYVLPLAKWTQHTPACARATTTANHCTCGLDEAWATVAGHFGEIDGLAWKPERDR